MTVKDKVDEERRCFLRKATATMGGIGIAATSIPFISYWMPSTDVEAAGTPIEVDLTQIKPEQQLAVVWRGKPIWVIRRTKEMLDNLPKLNSVLRDPNSEEDQQPPYAKNMYRSIKPEIFVAIGICTHLGCIPTYRPDVGSVMPGWLGGFYCPCHGSLYDLAGRVYQNVPAPKNLEIPSYAYINDNRIIIGEDQPPANTKKA